MGNTINDLYLKYVNNVGETLEDDRYFQYLFEMVQAGENTLHQTSQVLHKVVDERWLTTIEESLDAINEIIDKPRRFVTTKEEVVPVALAKKITADSVRHLSMNTQFIASDEDGDIQPTRVLNVSTEESYDLYENRFVYHLIQRLVTFIDKRTDVIFWSTGDETRNTLKMESKVDDAYEEIEYKIEMKIKNRQSYMENDSDNMQVFMRIDRVRRLVMALRNSSFCSMMAGCSMVRSPIQRTNLMMKDPNYRTCYKLWQFLESYDEVGYSIEERDAALEFDEEYLIQMYTNLITNYTVFKSLLEGDMRDLTELAAEQREVVRPKFIKQIQEEIVDDYNIPDVEIRKVFVEEVTQAQLEAEAKLEEETALRQKVEEERDDALRQLENERWQMQIQMFEIQQSAQEQIDEAKRDAEIRIAEAKQETETKVAEVRHAAEEEIAGIRQEAEALIAEAQQEAETRVSEAQQEAETKVAEAQKQAEAVRQEAEMKVEETKRSAEEEIAGIRQKAEAKVVEAQAEAGTKVAEAQKEAEEVRKEAEVKVADTIRTAEEKIAKICQETEEEVAKAQQEAEMKVTEAQKQAEETCKTAKAEVEEAWKQAEAARQEAESKVAETLQNAEAEIDEARKQVQEIYQKAEMEVAEARKSAEDKIAEAQREAEREVEDIRLQAERMVEEARQAMQEAQEAMKEAQRREKEALKCVEKEAKARKKAEAKAEENRLTNRIIAAWLEYQKLKNTTNEEENAEEKPEESEGQSDSE